jgi:transcriptional regulator with XRE-family HTH domain
VGGIVVQTASEIDAHVGRRVRERREHLGISQGRLGRHLGLTFSQVQKYEKGSNRIGAGRLYQIATYLGVSPMHFYEGIEAPGAERSAEKTGERSRQLRDELNALTEAYAMIADPDTRRSVMALVKSLGAPNNSDNGANPR